MTTIANFPRRTFLRITLMTTAAIASLDALKSLAASPGKQVFTILHTNDLHSNLIGVGPFTDYTPMSLNDDATKGGYSRLASLIAQRRQDMEHFGPVLVLDAGDFSMGTAIAAASRELGAELQLMARMGYDATTFGNHEFDLGPDGLGSAISKAAAAGFVPSVVVSNTNLNADDPRLATLKQLAAEKILRPYRVIERGGLRFGIIGIIGYDALKYASDPGGVTFDDPIATAEKMADLLRDQEKADVVIVLSHGGAIKGKDGESYIGEDVNLLKAVPGIDIVIGGHTHTALFKPLLIDDRAAVQTGKYGENLGELVISLKDGKVKVESYRLIPIEGTIMGDRGIQQEVDRFVNESSQFAFASRGYRVTQPLVVISEDWQMDYRDIESGTPLANVVTDAFRQATGADVAFTANGLIRAALIKGNSGIQTVYDVFSLAPLGEGVIDPTAGSAMVRAYFTGRELKNMLEFFLIDDPHHPGEYFPRVSGMRFFYDPSRPKLEQITQIELGDLDKGYRAIDMCEGATKLYSFACSLYVGVIIAALPRLSKGAVQLVPKKADGTPIKSRTDAIVDPRESTGPYVLHGSGSLENDTTVTNAAQQEVKEWQAIMDYLVSLPNKNKDGISVLEKRDRAREVRAIKVSRDLGI
jgi:5'-nucleotidase / UDP-sugar diphosphatase